MKSSNLVICGIGLIGSAVLLSSKILKDSHSPVLGNSSRLQSTLSLDSGSPSRFQERSTKPLSHQSMENHNRSSRRGSPVLVSESPHAESLQQLGPVAIPRQFLSRHPTAQPVWPASLVALPDSPEDLENGLEKLANEFNENLISANAQADSPEYHKRFMNESWLNDIRFKTRYGGHAWHSHHIETNHLLGNPQAGND